MGPTRPARPLISFVVPMHNEELSLETFFGRVGSVMQPLDCDYEIVCVNDGSRDATMNRLVEASQRDGRIKVVDLTRNFGKDIALTAGLDYATGDAVVPIDADLQDPPECVPEMIRLWREGWDVVYGTRIDRSSDTLGKRISANWFYQIFNSISEIPIPANTGDFRLMDRLVVGDVRRLRERNRFMKGMFAWVGYRQTSVDYARPVRQVGETSWNLWKLWNFALDGIVAFTTLPLRVWSYLGVLISVGSFLYAVVLMLRVLVFGADVPGYASIMVVVLVFGGLQLLTMGIVGEYLARIYLEVKQRPLYLVRETHGLEPTREPAPH